MLLNAFLSVLLTIFSVVSGLPTVDDLETVDEVQLSKRDAPLSDRDLGLAEMHGVNLAESFKHSVINRSNGDDITVWVHQSFQEERDIDPAGDLAERQVKTLDWYGDSSTSYRRCHSVRYGDKTTSTSPTADKTEALATWARKTSGSWLLSALPFKGPKWLDVAVAGSDSGENIKLSMHFMTMEGSQLATSDVLDIATHVQTNFKRKFGNVWRAEADGGHMCSVAIYISFTGRPVSHWAHWRLLGTADRV